MVDAILYADLGGFPASLDERPARYVRVVDVADVTPPSFGPWRRMTDGELRERIEATEAAWSDYVASLQQDTALVESYSVLKSPDGQQWRLVVTNLGVVTAEKVTP